MTFLQTKNLPIKLLYKLFIAELSIFLATLSLTLDLVDNILFPQKLEIYKKQKPFLQILNNEIIYTPITYGLVLQI